MAKIEEIGGPVRLTGQTKATVAAIFVMVVAFIIVSIMFTGIDRVDPGEAAVVINNTRGTRSVVTKVGYVIHLPFNMTEVYKYNTEDQSLSMSSRDRGPGGGLGGATGNSVRIKTKDGSNVDLDVEIKFKVLRETEGLLNLANSFGEDRDLYQVNELIRSFARSYVREILGQLYIFEITDASQRQQKAIEVREAMNADLEKLGVIVDSVSILNLHLNEEYNQMIKDRKDADQILVNQKSAQANALQEQAQQIAAATREKNTALEQEKGLQGKRIIEAQGKSKQDKARADGQAARLKVEGDKTYEVALNEAKAIETEGLTKAEGILKLSEAYRKGGIALVREALAEKYVGRTINGRPYTLSDVVERLALEPSTAAAAAVRSGYISEPAPRAAQQQGGSRP